MRDLKVKVVHILSFDIKNDMSALIRKKNNCDILKLIAYGHSVNPVQCNIYTNESKIYVKRVPHSRIVDE